jgi:Protein of unknown function (DUF4058)
LAAELLTPQIRPTFIARLDEHIYIHELPASQRMLVGRAPIAIDEQREAYVEIRDRQTRELVTVIELLSPSNKRPGPDREQYLAKRRRLFASWVNLVEIDLLRAGPQLPMEDLQPCDYYALVSRYGDRPSAGVWPIRLREPLPKVPIPLRDPHADASLDLQQMLHRLYDAAGYEDYIYSVGRRSLGAILGSNKVTQRRILSSGLVRFSPPASPSAALPRRSAPRPEPCLAVSTR